MSATGKVDDKSALQQLLRGARECALALPRAAERIERSNEATRAHLYATIRRVEARAGSDQLPLTRRQRAVICSEQSENPRQKPEKFTCASYVAVVGLWLRLAEASTPTS